MYFKAVPGKPPIGAIKKTKKKTATIVMFTDKMINAILVSFRLSFVFTVSQFHTASACDCKKAFITYYGTYYDIARECCVIPYWLKWRVVENHQTAQSVPFHQKLTDFLWIISNEALL